MLQNIKRTIKHTSIYGTGTIASKLIGVILLPLYTKHISIDDFGVYGLFEVVLQLLSIVAIGIPIALQRWIGLEEYQEKKGSLLFTSFSFLAIYQLVLFLILIPLGLYISDFLFQKDFSEIIYIIFATVYIQVLSRIPLVLLFMNERSVFYSTANLLKIAVHLGSTVYLITVPKLGILSIFYGELAGSIVLLIFMIPYLFKQFTFRFDFYELKSMIKYGAPTIFGNFSRQIFSFTDRNLLALFVTEAAVGTYSLGFKISNIIGTFFVTSFNTALPAIAWKQVGTNNQNRFFTKTLTYFTFILIWSSLFLALYNKGILHLFAKDPEYWDAHTIVPILLVGFIFNGMFTVMNYGLLVTKTTNKIPLILFISLGMDIIVNLILVRYFSYTGTAIAMMFTSIIRTLLTYLLSRKLFPVNWEFRKIFTMLFLAIIIYFISFVFNSYEIATRFTIKGLMFLSFPALLYCFNFYEKIEIETLKKLSKQYLLFKKNK